MRMPTPKEYKLIIESVRDYNPNACVLHPTAYRVYEENGKLIGFIAILKVSWYATEIRHLYVLPRYRKKGYGKKIIKEVLKQIPTPIVLATTSTPEAEKVITNAGFELAHEFTNPRTGNKVKVFIFRKEVGCKESPVAFPPTVTN